MKSNKNLLALIAISAVGIELAWANCGDNKNKCTPGAGNTCEYEGASCDTGDPNCNCTVKYQSCGCHISPA